MTLLRGLQPPADPLTLDLFLPLSFIDCALLGLPESSPYGVRCEQGAAALVELVLEFNPVESEGMKEGLHEVHRHEYSESERDEDKESEEQLKELLVSTHTDKKEPDLSPGSIVFSKNTLASCECASERAHSLR